jgi:hypothetical protein
MFKDALSGSAKRYSLRSEVFDEVGREAGRREMVKMLCASEGVGYP